MPVVIPGATQLEPFSQGSLSRLCGLYSILNAVQLGLYPRRLMPQQRKKLFLAAVGHLGRKGVLQQVLGVGMEEAVWLNLAEAINEYVEKRFAMRLRLRRLEAGRTWTGRPHVFSAIADAVEQRQPVLVYFGGALDHYTVISGHAEDRLLLFDSIGLEWVALNGIRLSDRSVRRNWIAPQSTFALVCRS